MKITYLPSDMDAPGSYRCLFPGRMLALKGGHDVQLPPHRQKNMPDGRLRTEFDIELHPPLPHADVWVLQQRLERLWSEEGVQALRTAGIASVADVDDNYLELPSWNPAFYGTHPYRRDDGVIVNREARRATARGLGWKKMPPNSSNRSHMMSMFERVDAMSVSTPYLKELYGKLNKNITVVRNYLDWDIWENVTPQYEVQRKKGIIKIGYLGVFRYRQGDLAVIKNVIRPFMDKHPNVVFVANTKEVHDFLDVPRDKRVTIGEYDFFPRDGGRYPVGVKTAVMDIGLVPLTPGGLNEGKSHLKGMEYNAAGIPFVASNTESYRYWTKKGVNGFIAETEKSWTNQLEWLVAKDSDRREMGACARKLAEQHSIQHHWPEWQDFFESVVGDEYNALARGAIVRGAVQKVSELANFLRVIGERSKPKLVVEIGSARGGTFWSLAQVAADDALLVSIDIPSGSPIDVNPITGRDVYAGRNREKFRSFSKEGQRVKLIDANSQKFSTVEMLIDTIGTQKIDVLFIDGDHRYEGVKRDYELYAPLVREGGLIGFHDVIRQNDPRSGVHLLWHQLRRKARWQREFIGGDDWGMGSWGAIGVMEQEEKMIRA